jgi:hypothetical protein
MTTTNTPRVVYLVPTRGRPARTVELLDAWETTRAGVADLVLLVDQDDPTLDQYREVELPEWAELVVGERLRLGGTLNTYAPVYARLYAGVGFMGDDHRPRSLRWDEQLAAELALGGPAAVVYGNDLIHGGNLPTAVLLGSLVVDELGYFVPPGMVHLWLDNYWLELGRRLGTLRYRADVVIEHQHPITGRVACDDGYREVNDSSVYKADEARFRDYVRLDLDVAVDRLRARLEEVR